MRGIFNRWDHSNRFYYCLKNASHVPTVRLGRTLTKSEVEINLEKHMLGRFSVSGKAFLITAVPNTKRPHCQPALRWCLNNPRKLMCPGGFRNPETNREFKNLSLLKVGGRLMRQKINNLLVTREHRRNQLATMEET